MSDDERQRAKPGSVAAPERERPFFETRAPGTNPSELLALFEARMPELGVLVGLREPGRQMAHAQTLSFGTRQALYASLVTLAFKMREGGQFAESLRLARCSLVLIDCEGARALQSYFQRSTAQNRGDVLSEIGRTHEQAGDLGSALTAYLEAEEWYERDAELRAEHGVDSDSEFDRVFNASDFRSSLYASIAGIHRKLNDQSRAGEYMALAHRHTRLGASAHDRAWRSIGYAQGAFQQREFDRALDYYRDALRAAEADSGSPTGKEVVAALSGLAETYVELGLHRRALQFIERSLDINTRAGNELRQQANLLVRARAKLGLGDHTGAVADFRESLRFCTVSSPGAGDDELDIELGGEARRIVRLEPAVTVLLAMARATQGRDPVGARGCLVRAALLVERLRGRIFSGDERIAFQETSGAVFDELIDMTYMQYVAERQSSLAEELFCLIERAKSRVLAEQIADQPLVPPDVDGALIAREAQLLQREKDVEAGLRSAPSTALASELDSVREELGALWDRIASASGRGSEYSALRRSAVLRAPEVRTLVARDAERAAIVNYYLTAQRLIAVVLSSDREDLEIVATEVGRAELRDLVAVNRADPPSLDRRLPFWSMDLPPIVIDPIRECVAGYPLVVLVPHDVLHGLPLHALSVRGTEPLLSSSAVSFSPSVSVLHFCLQRRPASSGPAFVLGAPDRPEETPLPNAATEAVAVASILGVGARLAEEATKEAFLREASGAAHIHLACHNRFDPEDPLASSLLLTGGDLSARDILGMKLDADLVVLSACQSGVSQYRAGDELMGVVRALLVAGASSVLVSLWNAYDVATAQLMGEFYRRRVNDKQSKVEALCGAQRDLCDRSLAEWGAFVLLGSWN